MNRLADFTKSIEALHNSANRITNGLTGIVQTIDSVAKEHADILSTPHDDSLDDDDVAVSALLKNIRKQITEIVSHGHQFEHILDDYAADVSDLSRQINQTRHASRLDSTTGLANRKSFLGSLQNILEHLAKYNNKVSILMADIDRFKIVNDDLGHDVGDQVLRLVASNMVANLGENDIVARWGEDEFAAILPNSDLTQATDAAEKVRHLISSRAIKKKHTGEAVGKVTLSIGTSSYREGDTPETLISRAEQAQFMAKHHGRNRTVAEQD